MTTSAAKRQSLSYQCADCGWTSMKWVGKCGGCQAWGSVGEQLTPARPATPALRVPAVIPISAVQAQSAVVTPSGVAELDRVLGGGIVPGAVVLLAGEPGVGKSTLLLEVAASAARRGRRALYVTGEESASQVRSRAERTGAVVESLFLAAEVDLDALLGSIDVVQPELVVVDSVQTMSCGEIDGVAGGVTQVRAVTAALVQVAKQRNLPIVLVGHVTKDGSVAGPRALEHIVDVVLQFEGDRSSRLRLLRSTKNRFGPVDEIGCFDLSDRGIVEVADASGLFLSRHPEPISGTCVTVTVEGRRPLLAEVQALVNPTATPAPRRSVSGLDSSRLAMLLAVLDRRAGIRLGTCDVYAATVGGAALRSPGSDLAVALALASAARDQALPDGTVAFGEVGLAGELRRVPDIEQRLAEAARLGFTAAVIPAEHRAALTAVPAVNGMGVIECSDLAGALAAMRLTGSPSSGRPVELSAAR